MDDTFRAPPPPAVEILEGELIPAKKDTRFVKGDPRINRLGRKQGAKQLLAGQFLRDLLKWHKTKGMKAIEKVGRDKPEELLRIIATFIPKHDILEVGHHIGSIPVVDLQELERRSSELLARIADRNAADAGKD